MMNGNVVKCREMVRGEKEYCDRSVNQSKRNSENIHNFYLGKLK